MVGKIKTPDEFAKYVSSFALWKQKEFRLDKILYPTSFNKIINLYKNLIKHDSQLVLLEKVTEHIEKENYGEPGVDDAFPPVNIHKKERFETGIITKPYLRLKDSGFFADLEIILKNKTKLDFYIPFLLSGDRDISRLFKIKKENIKIELDEFLEQFRKEPGRNTFGSVSDTYIKSLEVFAGDKAFKDHIKNYKSEIQHPGQIYNYVKKLLYEKNAIRNLKKARLEKKRKELIFEILGLLNKGSKISDKIKNIYDATKVGIYSECYGITVCETPGDAHIISLGHKIDLNDLERRIKSNLKEAINLGLHKRLKKYVLQKGVGAEVIIHPKDFILGLCEKFDIKLNQQSKKK